MESDQVCQLLGFRIKILMVDKPVMILVNKRTTDLNSIKVMVK